MAPVDRHERRQQRVRGAGASAVQANFGFNLAAFAPGAKQASAPPQSSRRTRTPTPSRRTPGSSKISARSKRHRSVSVHRSGSVRRNATPRNRTVTPQTGKRKRGSQHASPAGDDGELDDLSPEHEERFPSVGKNRRVTASITPIREEADDAPDELSILEDEVKRAQNNTGNGPVTSRGTSASVSGASRGTPKPAKEKTSVTDGAGNKSISLRQSIVRRSKSIELHTPKPLPNGHRHLSSASHFDTSFNTPNGNPEEDDSEDELTPQPNRDETPRTVVPATIPAEPAPEGDDELDELSSPAQPVRTPKPSPKPTKQPSKRTPRASPVTQQEIVPTGRRGRPRRVVTDDEEDEVQATPASNNQSQDKRKSNLSIEEKAYPEDNNDIPDELSPDTNRTKQHPTATQTIVSHQKQPRKTPEAHQTIDISSAEESDNYDSDDHSDEVEAQANRPITKSKPKPTSTGPPSPKRQKIQPNTGPRYSISVMRLKPPTSTSTKPPKALPSVRGISAADTAHTLMTQTTDAYITRLASKLAALPSSKTPQHTEKRRLLRTQINLALSYTESLREKMLDLQDMHDVLTSLHKTRKTLHAQNTALRKDFLAVQNERHEVALQTDDTQATFDAEKRQVESREKLSSHLFDIQEAVRRGRDAARREGREHEGVEMGLGLWVEVVGRAVGSSEGGGGVLDRVEAFNRGLERAAGWLEGRA